MVLEFYMRRKLLNVHIPDLAHLAERVHQVELMKKEKEKYRNEQKLKSKPFTQKEKVAYVTMESSEEEFDLETEVDLAELEKGPPYICSLLKKLHSNEKSNESKPKSGKNIVLIFRNLNRFSMIYPRAGDGLLDFLVQQKIKDRDVFLCTQCNAVFVLKLQQSSKKKG
ncbi:hypothetical protein Ahy_A10g048990 [Arachis hypogaea]|uniref:Uncharacterized protein n=1 Tax=Arachis hypogaea TaxID=3818 RepID=A0A445B6H0_ARAHY|nr:hypothetical protein Ahy_A10g048990 [Arachis hypogaea]